MQLHEADQHRIQNCVDQLFDDQPKVPAIIAIIPKFLAGDGTATQTVVVECQKNWRLGELKRIETFLLGLQQVSFLSFQLTKKKINCVRHYSTLTHPKSNWVA